MRPKPHNPTPEGLRRALDALSGLYGAVTDADRKAHRQMVAAEMARAEARRRDEPQLELPE